MTIVPLHVLVVEDDPTVSEVVVRYLEREGLTVETATDGSAALAQAAQHWPDVVVLDLMLPGIDGIEVCRRLRAEAPVPVIMLTARGEEDDKVVGLELGADDYITKPFSPREVIARIEAVLRRAGPPSNETAALEAGALRLDHARREAHLAGKELTLTPAACSRATNC